MIHNRYFRFPWRRVFDRTARLAYVLERLDGVPVGGCTEEERRWLAGWPFITVDGDRLRVRSDWLVTDGTPDDPRLGELALAVLDRIGKYGLDLGKAVRAMAALAGISSDCAGRWIECAIRSDGRERPR